MVIPQFLDERELLAFLFTFFSFLLESHRDGTNQKLWCWCLKDCPHVFSPADELPKHARAPLSNAHWSSLKGKPTGLPVETGNTRRKKGRCVGVKRRSGIIKRRTELDMLCLGEKESNNFSPNNDSAQTSRGRSHCTHSCVFFYFILFWVRMRQTGVTLRF